MDNPDMNSGMTPRYTDATPHIGSIAPRGLCDSCLTLDLAAYLKEETDYKIVRGLSAPADGARQLGLLRDMCYKAATCSFCWIVVQSICTTTLHRELTPRALLEREELANDPLECCIYSYCFMHNERLGDAAPQSKAVRLSIATRISGVAIDTTSGKELQSDWHPTYLGDIQLLGEDSMSLIHSQTFFGRRIGRRLDIQTPTYWLSLCRENHGLSCGWNIPGLDMEPRKILVIDTHLQCVMKRPNGAAYFALSYCWPSSPGLCLTKANRSLLFQPGALKQLKEELPIAIFDAIKFVHELGERYLWIDALCIVQDDDEHKATQIAQMDKIYMSALLTIVPLIYSPDAEKACAGFPRYNPGIKCREQKIAQVQGMSLAVPFEAIQGFLDRGVARWGVRGWTFQECLLSSRILFLTESQAYFKCRQSVFCEDCYGEIDTTDVYIAPRTNLWNPGANSSSRGRIDLSYSSLHMHNEPYRTDDVAVLAYLNYVLEYSVRQLTNASDTLHAFTGIGNVLEFLLKTPLHYGLPEKYWDIALLFNPDGHRPNSAQFNESYPRNRQFPSWSWAGWDCAIDNGSYFPAIRWGAIRREVEWFLLADQREPHAIEPQVVSDPATFPVVGNKELRLRDSVPPSPYAVLNDARAQAFAANVSTQGPILACWTMITSFYLEGIVHVSAPTWEKSTQHLALRNSQKQWVGSVLVESRWAERSLEKGKKYEFLVISRSQSLYLNGAMKEASKVGVFDATLFMDRPWCLLNVMMVEMRDGFYERIGIGVVHEDGWLCSGPTTKLSMLK